MLIHPWDAARDDDWKAWLLAGHDFGQLVAAGRDRELPVVAPAHFVFDGDRTVWLHLARPNPVWDALAENPHALLSVIGDYTYVPAEWNAEPGTDPAHGVPTSYYASVQLACTARVLDDTMAKAELLTRQLAHFEPAGGRAEVSPVAMPDRRLLPGIRGLELTVLDVRAKFKYGGNKEAGHRTRIADRLVGRNGPMDAAAGDHVRRGMA